MPASRIHLVRHGEVHNPEGVLYGRLPQFALSARGHEMAAAAAHELQESGAKIAKIFVSPLLRTLESAQPIQDAYKLDVTVDDRLIEPYNIFEGKKVSASSVLLRPNLWLHLRNPNEPSWGEPYRAIVERMMSALNEIADDSAGIEVAVVSHQLPIWMVHQHLAGHKLAHNPNKRRCALSSITTIERDEDGSWREVSYTEVSTRHASAAEDRGAV
ncbi:MAG: histidine phosphatase family protein [Microbacteriaceae bacterium]